MKTWKSLVLGAAVLASCGSDNESTTSSSAANTSIDGVFSKATKAVTSSYSTASSVSFVGSKGLATISATPTCSDGTTTSASTGDSDFAGEDIYCMLNSNSKSPDSVQGSYFIVAGVLCAVEKQVTFTYASDYTVHNNISISETDSCFDGGFDATDDGDTNDTFTVSVREKSLSGVDYDYEVQFQLDSTSYDTGSDPSVQFYLKDSDNKLAARVYQKGFKDIFEFVMDSENNAFYFENLDYDNSRHMRIAVNGTFDASTGNFSSVSSAKVVHSEGASGSYVTIMDYSGSSDAYDHYVSGSQDTDYSSTTSTISFNVEFYNWGSKVVTDHSPESDSLLDLSTFTMNDFQPWD